MSFHAQRALSRGIAVVALALTLGASGLASAAPGTGYWYWPTGTEDFGGMSPWWDFRGYCWHLAQDMRSPSGHVVYSIGSGTVLESKYVSGYGPGGGQGGAVVILHKTATGKEFKALYGHLYDLKYEKGDSVKAGAVVGRINNSSPNHLHFGIHPGRAYPSDNNPYRGHTYTSSNDYGFVNPVKFLRANPRLIPYKEPALPVVASRTTTTAPVSLGAVAGTVYWSERSQEETTTWRWSIARQTMSSVSTDTTLPAFDCERYQCTISAIRPGFTVKDRMPRLTGTPSDTTPPRGTAIKVQGSLRNASRLAFQGARVALERLDGDSWVVVGRGLVGVNGVYSIAHVPAYRSQLRVRFSPPTEPTRSAYLRATSATITVAPHVAFTKPTLSDASPSVGQSVRVSTVLLPRHPSTSTVRFLVDRNVDGKWVRVADKRAVLTDAERGSSCRAYVRLATKGSYRVRAYMAADKSHAATYSGALAFTVR